MRGEEAGAGRVAEHWNIGHVDDFEKDVVDGDPRPQRQFLG